MNELHLIIQALDLLPNDQSRKQYLDSIQNNPSIDKNDLRKLACNVLLENNFIKSYYKHGLIASIKRNAKRFYSFLKF